MAQSKLMELTYYDPGAEVRLTAYADTLILDRQAAGTMLCAVRFGGYPEVTRAMADAIYGGAVVEAIVGTETIRLQAIVKRYRRQFSHDGIYAVATLLANDEEPSCQGAEEAEEQTTMEPRQCYLFCPAGDRERLFEELDHKTAAPLIPAFRDYVLDTLIPRRDLRPLRVLSLREKLDAWVLELQHYSGRRASQRRHCHSRRYAQRRRRFFPGGWRHQLPQHVRRHRGGSDSESVSAPL